MPTPAVERRTLALLRDQLNAGIDVLSRNRYPSSLGPVYASRYEKSGMTESLYALGRGISLEKLRDYATGNQFGYHGAYWRGRQPDPEKTDGWDEIEATFTQDDQIGPGIRRFVGAILGKDFDWDVVTPDGANNESSALVDAVEKVMTDWHYASRVHRTARFAVFAQQWGGSGYLRAYVPSEYDPLLGGLTGAQEALDLIHVQALDATQAGSVVDEHGRTVAMYYRYAEGASEGRVGFRLEVHYPDEIVVYDESNGGAVLVYPEERDGDGNVVVEARTARYASPFAEYNATHRRDPLYLIVPLERMFGSCISPGMIDKQDRLNVSWTNAARNDDLAAFRNVIVLNGADPQDETGADTFWEFGPDVVASIKGFPKTDPQTGEETGELHTPAVQVIEPIRPDEFFLPQINALRRAIREEMDMTWLEAIDKAVSGDSKQETREPFYERVQDESTEVGPALAALLKAVYLYAAVLGGNADEKAFAQSISFRVKLALRIRRSDLRTFQAQIQAADEGYASLETVVSANPMVSDPQDEIARLTRRAQELNLDPVILTQNQRATIDSLAHAVQTNALTGQFMAQLVGLPEAEAAAMVAARVKELEAQGNANGTAGKGQGGRVPEAKGDNSANAG